ncbi:MAG: hypothetical protein H6Q14_1856 [Bacteroidetes bacterium]|nr:hypothetical protein [Bacteroidota bacterium]
MKSILWDVLACCLLSMFFTQLPAQEMDDPGLKKVMSDSLTMYIRKQIAGKTTVKSIVADAGKKQLTVTVDENLAYLPFTDKLVSQIETCVRNLLQDSLKKYRLTLISDGQPISELIPNVYRSGKKDQSRIFNNKANKVPLVRRESQPFQIRDGLSGRHIALWPSHGWYYEQKLARWEWQRARMFQTVEDLFPMSFVVPYLVPMLENAGANVLLPRERDYHREEVIVDNDASRYGSIYREINNAESWSQGSGCGFAEKKNFYLNGENPFSEGSFRQTRTTTKKNTSLAEWIPNMPEKGDYAVYVSYKSFPNSTTDARYTIHHLGGKTEFKVNQKMGGGTWIYLGTFTFGKGANEACRITLSNLSDNKGAIVTADAVKIGGGIGNIARSPNADGYMEGTSKHLDGGKRESIAPGLPIPFSPEVSGRPRYTEGARYWLQWAGVPDSVYSRTHFNNDYSDDFQSRGYWVNYLAGGSPVLPAKEGLRIPVDLSFAFHTDAGDSPNDSIVGTLGIYMTHHNNEVFENGQSRWASRDLTTLVMDEIVQEIRSSFEPKWTRRGMWNKSYSEARMPNVPSMLLELLSHENYADMRYGLDPKFRFAVSRAIYKGMLRFLAGQYNSKYVVQPLPVESFSSRFVGDTQVQLQWKAVNDSLEPSSQPTSYVLYTRIGDGGFDNGKVIKGKTSCTVDIDKDKIYSFKIMAANDGGISFPSEILSVCRKSYEKGVAMIVNGFTRVSAPASWPAKDTITGFADFIDHGVPDKVEFNYVGSQYEFYRSKAWTDDDAPGFGGSNANYEQQAIAGNTFDYPALHGACIAEAGYSFVSASKSSIANQQLGLEGYDVVDLILGKEREWTVSYGAKSPQFKTFPLGLQEALTKYCQEGGNLLVTGAYLATDLWDNPRATKADRDWATQILRIKWRTNNGAVAGRFKAVASPFEAFKGQFEYYNELNEESYAVEHPDAIEPSSREAYTIFRYSENNLSAGVAFKGSYSSCVLGIPFESVKPAMRSNLMKAVLLFFESNKPNK